METPINRIILGPCHGCGKPVYADQDSNLTTNNLRYHKNCHKYRSQVEITENLREELL